jgi:serine/threonine-protein phosphatase 2A activator
VDYGTGHESTFVALLLCLAKVGVFTPEDQQALVTRVFAAYLELMRKVQTTYWLDKKAHIRGLPALHLV